MHPDFGMHNHVFDKQNSNIVQKLVFKMGTDKSAAMK